MEICTQKLVLDAVSSLLGVPFIHGGRKGAYSPVVHIFLHR